MKAPIFFKKKKNFFLNQLFPQLNLKKKLKINNIKPLDKSEKFDLTFFESTKYKILASYTKASYCLTSEKLEKFLPKTTERIIVKNVLFELAKI